MFLCTVFKVESMHESYYLNSMCPKFLSNKRVFLKFEVRISWFYCSLFIVMSVLILQLSCAGNFAIKCICVLLSCGVCVLRLTSQFFGLALVVCDCAISWSYSLFSDNSCCVSDGYTIFLCFKIRACLFIDALWSADLLALVCDV